MDTSERVSRFALLSALAVFVLFLAILVGVSVAQGALAVTLIGRFTLGEALVLILHVLPVALGFEYLRRTPHPDATETSERETT